MKNGKLRVVFIVAIVILLIVLISYIFLNVFIGKKDENNNKIPFEELVKIDDARCVDGYCVQNFKFTKLEDNTYNFEYVFKNTNNFDLKKSCFKLIFAEEENYIFCIKELKSGKELINTLNFESDYYSKYDDYNIVKMSEEDTKKYYDAYFKNLK